jgi:flagellar basal-body rod protein FlgB
MSDIRIFDRTTVLLEKVLDLRARNQQLIASNLANAQTPGFEASRLSFDEDLQNALQAERPGPQGLEKSRARIENIHGSVDRSKKAVEPDQEMIDLAENQILYESAVQMLNKKFGMLKYVTQEGR